MVARLLFVSVSLAQKPKSAARSQFHLISTPGTIPLTDLDVADAVEQNVVTLDITVDDVLAVQVGQPLASLPHTY